MDTGQMTRHGSQRRGAILEAVAFAAEHLLLAEDWHAAAPEVVAHLGIAAEASRAYVVENERPPGDPRATWIAEWTDERTARLSDDPEAQRAPWRGAAFDRWADELQAGRSLIGLVDDLPPAEAAVLRSHDISSIVAFPLISDGRWLGSVGFDDRRLRLWEAPELDALGAAARLLAAAIARHHRDEEAIQAERRYQAFIERIPAATYTDLPVDGTGETTIGFMSPQIEGILGYPAQVFLDDPGLWYRLIQPDDMDRLRRTDAMNPNDTGRFDEEYRMRAADGRWVWVHDTSTAVFRDDGTVEHFLGFLADVTLRRQTEDRLREAEERFRLTFEHMPAIAYHEPPTPEGEPYDLSSSEWYVSPQVERVLGYTPDQLAVSGFWMEITHPDDLPTVLRESERTARTGDVFRLDYRMIARDGHIVWFHDESVLVRDEHGAALGWHGLMMDVTERREAEAALEQSEHRYRTLVDGAPDAIMVRVDDRYVYANPQAAAMFGATDPSQLYGLQALDIVPEAFHDLVRTGMELQRAGQATPPVEQRIKRLDGREVDVEVSGIPIAWEGQSGVHVVFRNITDRVESGLRLREAEEKFRTIVEQSPAVIYTQEFDPGEPSVSRTTYISPRQEELVGYTADDVIADPTLWTRQIHPDDRDRVLAADSESNLAGTSTFSMEYRLVRKDGRIIWVEDQAELVQVGERPPFWQGFLLDISERKHTEEQLARALDVEREAAERLRALDEMKNTFLQAVSHDLRTPLSAILGLAVTLERSDRLQLAPDDARDLAGRIAGNARRLDRLVINLLDMDRLARGIVEPAIEPTDVGAVVRRVLGETGLISASRIRAELPELIVPADPAKLERIVENLLANTARHAPADATVWVSVRPDGDGITLLVEDDGPGVAPEMRDAIFDPFRQGSEDAKHSPGVGVGLTLVRRFAELHGGRAWVEEREGGGASFRVWLPASARPTRTTVES